MTTFELLFCATILRGAFAVLLLLAAEAVLRERFGAKFRRLLWAGCLILILVPQMNFSASPFRLDLSPLRTTAAAGQGGGQDNSVSAMLASRETALRAATNGDMFRVFRHRLLERRKSLEMCIIGLLPLPALLLLLRRYLRCRRMIRPLPPVTDARVLANWNRVLEECGPLPRPVILLDSGERKLGPTLFGCFTRKLLLPVESLRELSEEELRLLLEHEYHHSRAGDPFLNILSLALWAFAWYNPFMRIARRKLCASCELECDRKIIVRHPHAVREYGNLLLRFAAPSASATATLPGSIGLAGSPHELSRRIRNMTTGGGRSAGKWTAFLLAAALIAPVCLIAVNVKSSRPRPVAAGASAPALPPKPVLPHLVLTQCELKSKPEGVAACWIVFYPEHFPFERSRLRLENGEQHQETTVSPGKRYLFLRNTEDGFRLETAERLSPEEERPPLRESTVLVADRKPHLMFSGSGALLFFTLSVDNIAREELSGSLPAPSHR